MGWACAKDGKPKYTLAVVGQMFGKRPVGKPRKRWLDAVKEDSYQMLKWRDWEVKVQDRVENQEGQGPLWAVVALMMMMIQNQNSQKI
jgi:hypothetical protein